jgi:hypothetical protein
MLKFFEACPSYFTSWDGWSKFGMKFVSQTYHVINPETFEYKLMLLDLIPCFCAQYGEVMKGLLVNRQSHWTNDMDSAPLAAGECFYTFFFLFKFWMLCFFHFLK